MFLARSTTRRPVARVLATALAVFALAACGGSSPSPSPSTVTDGGTTGGPTPTPSAQGCAPGGGAVPAGASSAPTVDLDGDGAADTLWLSAGLPRTLGVSTASGAVFSTEFSSGAPQAATALAQRLADGTVIILLNTGRAVPLYAVIDCAIVPTKNAQGQQYTFDLGFTGFGTGVGCADVGSGRQLVGLNAVTHDNGATYDVTRTPIDLGDRGRTATNGTPAVVGTALPADDPAVSAARAVTCDDAPPPVTEPAG
ncbi:hypothetical protein [Georgenia sp. SYP-B2076]|uniref:hypothetical protein n=1 Tax=Georgenia sp. SYP-B2076 TaxID=2495881 RepID=UPI000F8EE772|nr:hypothetical protein [Georgenia sp. SYP-B2076]